MKFKSKLCLAALTAAATGLAIPAIAQVGAGTYPGTSSQSTTPANAAPSADFSKLDVNGDGAITKQEARKDKAISKAFNSLDTNKDGKLDATEFGAYSGDSGGSSTAKP